MDQEVYESKEFAEYAKKNLVLVRADFPRRTALPDDVKEGNKELKQKFAPDPTFKGYPTTVIVDKKGEKVGEKVGYRPGSGPKAFISDLEKIGSK